MNYQYFPEDEMKCKCCGKWAMKDSFMQKLIELREMVGGPLPVTSGYRCEHYDKQMDGTGNHPQGKAADIKCRDSVLRWKIIEGAVKLGFNRIGIDKEFIHLDTCTDRAQEVLWLY